MKADRQPPDDTFTRDLFVWYKAVLADHDLPGLAFPVAFAIGQHVNRESGEAWCGQPCIAAAVGRDERRVRPAIKALVDRGHLLIAKQWGDGQSTRYRLSNSNRTKSSASDAFEPPANRTKPSGEPSI